MVLNDLKGKVAIVTGASKGIGKAIAIALAKEGVQVVLAARNLELLLHVQNEIQNFRGQSNFFGNRCHIRKISSKFDC